MMGKERGKTEALAEFVSGLSFTFEGGYDIL